MFSHECPCTSGTPYASCCGRLHHAGVAAPTAEALMRARYTAFAVRDAAFLYRTWHPFTRPDDVVLDDDLIWTGLAITDTSGGSELDDEGEVAFIAAWLAPDGRRGELFERSRFVRRGGQWHYLDGELHTAHARVLEMAWH
ncbi:MAG: YchJ family metal-binding protein [Nocardioidaceae bacterium]